MPLSKDFLFTDGWHPDLKLLNEKFLAPPRSLRLSVLLKKTNGVASNKVPCLLPTEVFRKQGIHPEDPHPNSVGKEKEKEENIAEQPGCAHADRNDRFGL